METKNKKMAYESPELKVVRFQVEKGFALSGSTPTADNPPLTPDDANGHFCRETERGSGSESWF